MNATFRRLSNMTAEKRAEYEKEVSAIYTKGVNGFIFEKPLEEFNEDGLKYDPAHLFKINKAILFLPIEFMQKYADAITVNMLKYERDDLILNTDFNFNIDKSYDNINTTSIGNLAYISLNINDKEIENKCNKALHDLFTKYYREVMEILKNNTAQC